MSKKNKYFTIILIAFLIITAGCAARKPVFIIPDFKRPVRIAVLPFENESNDIEAGELFRTLIYKGMEKKDLILITLEEIDETLLGLGITDGGQLASISQDELMKALDVRSLLYGTLKKCNYITAGLYMKKEVLGNVQLYEENELIWEDEASKQEKEFRANIKKALGEQIQKRVLEKALKKFIGHPHMGQLKEITKKMLKTIPDDQEEKNE
ncbi:hypothetical protein ACFLUV_03730 [Elusimicrobiota bacterium]